MSKPADILRLMHLLGDTFAGPTWRAWRVVLRALFALPMSDEDVSVFTALTGRDEPPAEPAREAWFIVGRRGGKSLISALLAVHAATCRSYSLAPGERAIAMIVAADRRQATVVRRYIGGLLNASPILRQLVARETQEVIDLTNGVSIEVMTCNHVAVRGHTCCIVIADEIAFWRSGDVASPDREVMTAIRPTVTTIPGAPIIALSSPYSETGLLSEANKRYYGQDGPVLVVKADTMTMHPSDRIQAEIDRAFTEDPDAAWSEYGRGGEIRFRSDISSFVPESVVEAVTVPGRVEIAPIPGVTYTGFLDHAGGSGTDSATLAISHVEERNGRRVGVLDCLREVRPPFSPEAVCRDFAVDLKRYRLTQAKADRYAAGFAVEAMKRHGVTLKPADRVKSAIYREALPLLNSGLVELLDSARLRAQLCGLERRVARGGSDSIDHGPGGHDDIANAACGALVEALSAEEMNWEAMKKWLDTGSGRRTPTLTESGPSWKIDGREVSEREYLRERLYPWVARETQAR